MTGRALLRRWVTTLAYAVVLVLSAGEGCAVERSTRPARGGRRVVLLEEHFDQDPWLADGTIRADTPTVFDDLVNRRLLPTWTSYELVETEEGPRRAYFESRLTRSEPGIVAGGWAYAGASRAGRACAGDRRRIAAERLSQVPNRRAQ